MATIIVYVAHSGQKVIAYSLGDNLDHYLSAKVKVSAVRVDINRYYNATHPERVKLIQNRLKAKAKGKCEDKQVITVGRLKEIIKDRGIADDTPITYLFYNEQTQESHCLAITDFENIEHRLDLIADNDYLIADNDYLIKEM